MQGTPFLIYNGSYIFSCIDTHLWYYKDMLSDFYIVIELKQIMLAA